MKKDFKKYGLLGVMVILALVVRFFLSAQTFNGDLLSNASWGEWIYKNGSKGFYENTHWLYAWPSQLPLINLINAFNYFLFEEVNRVFVTITTFIALNRLAPTKFLWFFDFVSWFGTALYGSTHFVIGFLISMKIIPILTDMIIAILAFFFYRKDLKKALIVFLLILFLPFSWYLSSLWGQYDQLSSLLVILSFLLLYKRHFVWSSLMLQISFQVKPLIVIFIPFWLFLFLLQKPSARQFIFSIMVNIAAAYLTILPFTAEKNPFYYAYQVILPKVFNSDRFGLAAHTFNLWELLSIVGSSIKQTFIINLLVISVVNIFAFATVRKNITPRSLFTALYLIAAGSFIFGTGMVDRYFYAAIILLGLLTAYYKNLLFLWIITALIFSFNLFYSWGFPIYSEAQRWGDKWIIGVFSALQIVIFFIVLKKLEVVKILKDPTLI